MLITLLASRAYTMLITLLASRVLRLIIGKTLLIPTSVLFNTVSP